MGRFGTLIAGVVVALALALAAPLPAAGYGQEHSASSSAHQGDAAQGGGHHASEPGPWAWADLAIWTVVVFLVLLFVLRRYAWGPMLTGLKQREDNIRMALDEAAKAREEAQALRAAHQKEMDRAQQEVKGIIDKAKRDAELAGNELIAKAKADMAAERERLHREIQTETDQALQSLWTRAADLATQVSAKAIRRQLDGDTQRRLIDEALAELKAGTGTNGYA